MATKAELAQDSAEYVRLLCLAQDALRQGDVTQAITIAVTSWPYVDGMMQFERKYAEREFDTVETIEIVLQYAPLIFDKSSLDSLQELLIKTKRIDKNADDDLAEKLTAARALMLDAHRLWNHLNQQPNCRQDELSRTLGGDHDRWRRIAEFWHTIGIVRRIPDASSYRLAFVTDMDELSAAKCPNCGVLAKARKAKLLEPVRCPKCKATVSFLIVCPS